MLTLPQPRTMKLQPLHDYVVVQPVKREQKSPTGIILPDTADVDQDREGVVKVVATGVTIPDILGKTVLFKDEIGTMRVKEDGVEYLLIHATDILGIYG